MLSFFSVLGTLGNALVLYVYVRKKNKIASTIFIICLAATDFVTSCVIMPFTMVMESVDYAIEHDALCKIYFFLITCNVPFSAFIMVAIAIDSFMFQIVIVFLLLVACGLGVMTALFHGVYIKGPIPNWTNKTDEQVRDSLRGELRDTLDDIEPTPPMAQSDWCGDEEAENNTLCAPLEYILDAMVKHLPGELLYQKIYSFQFLVSFIVVFLLYILIYRSVLVRRTKRLRARQKTNLRLLRDVSVTDTQVTAENGLQNGFEMTELTTEKRKAMETDNTLKEKYLLANIRTAAMLFVVTLVFILAFLPSWLMAHGVVNLNAIVFYFYFAYNVSNPIIYAFMNPAFRRELRDLGVDWIHLIISILHSVSW
nr:hypothetical protein BaRGS_015131 [Batillaria attramentaria]